jgi:magnesium-transporting ATPase (P-type)
VPSDIIRLRIGNIIPADARLLEGDPVQVDQSALTGESLPVEHKPGDTVYSGSILKQGEIDAVVYATGEDTYYGKTAQLVETAQTRSHLQRAVLKIADYLIIIAVVLAILIIGVAFFRHDQVLQFALVLTIAAVLVAMPAVLSVTMALGSKFLAAKQAIVTKLTSIEEVAGIDVLCSDKTGTLTQSTLTPGLSVIIDAIRESRKIFQRMINYAIYRIAETIRVLLLMTLSILIFNFYPVTAIMIVLLAILNDGTILSIAYDNVHYSEKPEIWNMRRVLEVATMLGVIGVVASFGLFYLGERVFHLARPSIQTLMYLKLSVAGQLTIYIIRTRGPFWSIKPAHILLLATGLPRYSPPLLLFTGWAWWL